MVIAFVVATVIFSEAIGFLAYYVYRLRKILKENTENLNTLAECVLHMAKDAPNIDVVEKSVDFHFPNSEGF